MIMFLINFSFNQLIIYYFLNFLIIIKLGVLYNDFP